MKASGGFGQHRSEAPQGPFGGFSGCSAGSGCGRRPLAAPEALDGRSTCSGSLFWHLCVLFLAKTHCCRIVSIWLDHRRRVSYSCSGMILVQRYDTRREVS